MKISLAEIDAWTKRLDNGRCFPFTLNLDSMNLLNTQGKKKENHCNTV